MSKMQNIKVTCKHCNEEFETSIYRSINVTLDPSLREKFLSGELFIHKCPHCGHEFEMLLPLVYMDMKNKFMVTSGYLSSVYESSKQEQENILKDFKNIFNDFTFVGARNPFEQLEKVIILENKLDIRVAMLYNAVLEHELSENTDIKESEHEIKDVFFEYEKGTLCSFVSFGENRVLKLPFDKDVYDDIYDKYADDLFQMDLFFFGKDSLEKFMSTNQDDDQEYLDRNIQVVIYEDKEGNENFAYIPSFSVGRFQEGDVVIIKKDNVEEYNKALIHHIIDTTIKKTSVNLEEAPEVLWKVKGAPLTTIGDSDDELENEDLLQELKKDKDAHYEEFLMTSDAIFAVEMTVDVPLDELLDESTDTMEVKPVSKPVIIEKNGKSYLAIYLDQSNVKNEHLSKFVYNINDIIETVYDNMDNVDGVIFNPEDEAIILNRRTLCIYKRNRYMTNSKRMVQLLEKLTPLEIKYMSEKSYKIISMVYFEGKVPTEIAVELKIPEKEVHDALDYGYEAMMHFVRNNY